MSLGRGRLQLSDPSFALVASGPVLGLVLGLVPGLVLGLVPGLWPGRARRLELVALAVDRVERVTREDVLDVGEYQFLMLLFVTYWYSPQENLRSRLLQSVTMAGGFSLAMYVLFSMLLNVQVPRGWLI